MHILIITPFYAPDIGPSAPLFTLLGSALLQRGHRVTVVAAVPHYTSGIVPQNFRGRSQYRSIENGVEIIRVSVPSVNRSNFRNRFLQFICFQAGALIASLSQKFDAAIITNPAIETWLPLTWHTVFRRKPVVFSVFDVYPDVGIKLGVFHSKGVINAVSALERSCLNHSAVVQIISENFRPGLRALGVADSKMGLVDVWVDTDFIRPLPRNNDFSRQNGLTGKFIVLYAGNLGLSQGLENVLSAAKILAAQEDIRFVLVGDGSERENLQSKASQLNLSNVQFLPFQPRERLPEVLASADVSLVLLRRGIGVESLPSKTFSALASARPILASVEQESELCKLVQNARAGICIPPEDPSLIAQEIMRLKNHPDLCSTYGMNGRNYVEQNNAVKIAAEKFEQLLDRAIRANS